MGAIERQFVLSYENMFDPVFYRSGEIKIEMNSFMTTDDNKVFFSCTNPRDLEDPFSIKESRICIEL